MPVATITTARRFCDDFEDIDNACLLRKVRQQPSRERNTSVVAARVGSPPTLGIPDLQCLPAATALCGNNNKRDWPIRLHGKGIDAVVTVAGDQIVNARWGNVHGMEALSEIVGCQRGFFELVPVTGSPQRTLYGHWQSQLHGALQVLHERDDEKCGDRTQAEMKTPDMLAIGPSPPT